MNLPRMTIRALVIGAVAITAFGLIAATTPPAPVSNLSLIHI